jgi:hypothetical protein
MKRTIMKEKDATRGKQRRRRKQRNIEREGKLNKETFFLLLYCPLLDLGGFLVS